MKIIWTENASRNYFQILDYLLNRWSESVANDFIDKVDSKLELLLLSHGVFEKVPGTNVQRILINKHVTLFYSVDGEKIHLIHFWNNSQNPENLKL
jgi:plasmid stabilization system protein ParE